MSDEEFDVPDDASSLVGPTPTPRAEPAKGDKPQEEEKPAPHIDAPNFDRSSYEEEVNRLAMWVDGFLVPNFVYDPSQARPWCQQWRAHRDAVSVLFALWLAWQELIDTERSGSAGPSTWFNAHLRPHMEYLRSPTGPFASCMRGTSRNEHRLPISAQPQTWK
ncbi:DUF4913 domain-containing protein [Marinactinospora rubrisoli]|uniref:DUF4913 domain-containing protein n=1 Tax=Marinactinospora rubrisoli TaxID=2715399 RepID=A0ABW2KQ19_9ACTN